MMVISPAGSRMKPLVSASQAVRLFWGPSHGFGWISGFVEGDGEEKGEGGFAHPALSLNKKKVHGDTV